jgi:hypothetical protein
LQDAGAASTVSAARDLGFADKLSAPLRVSIPSVYAAREIRTLSSFFAKKLDKPMPDPVAHFKLG